MEALAEDSAELRVRATWERIKLLWPPHYLASRDARVRREHLAELAEFERSRKLSEARVTLLLNPGAWDGGRMRCGEDDGGCGKLADFGKLQMVSRGDREDWILRCPACRKRRTFVSTTPETRRLMAEARDELNRLGRTGQAFERLAKRSSWGKAGERQGPYPVEPTTPPAP